MNEPQPSANAAAAPSQEMRAHVRMLYRTEVILRIDDGRQFVARSLDISAGGLGLLVEHDIAGCGMATLSMLLARDIGGPSIFRARARVAAAVYDGARQAFRTGLQFVFVDPASALLLDEFLRMSRPKVR